MILPRSPALVCSPLGVGLALAMFPAVAGAQVGQRNFYSALVTVGTDPEKRPDLVTDG
jgi:hypothetical protein